MAKKTYRRGRGQRRSRRRSQRRGRSQRGGGAWGPRRWNGVSPGM
jgi:hypothetical protein